MDIAQHTSATHGRSDTLSTSDSACTTTFVIPFADRFHDTNSRSLASIRSHDKPLVSSSSVRRKPLPPNASRRPTRFSSRELSSHVSLLPPVAIDVSIKTRVDFPPWEEKDFTSGKEIQGYSGEKYTNISQQRNTLPSQISQSLAISKSLAPSITSSNHSRIPSFTSIMSEKTCNIFNNPSSDVPSLSKMFLPLAKSPSSRKRVTPLSSPRGSAGSDSSQSPTSITSPQLSMVNSLFSCRGNIPTSLSSTPSSVEPCSPKFLCSPGDQDVHSAHTGLAEERSIGIVVEKANFQSEVTPQGSSPHLIMQTPVLLNVDEMENELKEISSELAASIKREMELEDQVDRLKAEVQMSSCGSSNRTSDYFSDFGTSYVKHCGESDSKVDELHRLIRKMEQSKAQTRLELTLTVNAERAKRKELELKIWDLEERASHVDHASINSLDASDRVRELENTCEELRKHLSEERQLKEKADELLSSLKSQLQESINERNNLRDEIVPQLRSQVEGLEMQAVEHEKLAYEQTKAEQALQVLGYENMALSNFQRIQIETANQMRKFSTISQSRKAEDRDSVSHGPNQKLLVRRRAMTLNSIDEINSSAQRIKDVELQRDSLHVALKSLLERQEHQNRENQKQVKQLETELERALSVSPKRFGYEKEVKQLRSEVNTLRARADEAITKKLQIGENLTLLKYELERAEQEIVTLKKLLLLEKHVSQISQTRPISGILISETLEDSYRNLQTTFLKSLDRVRSLRSENMTQETLDAFMLMEQSFVRVISERNFVKNEAEILKKQNKILIQNEKLHTSQELANAKEILDSAKRFEELAIQVRQQLDTNASLRQRLASMIEREEKEQELYNQRIKFLQERVKTLEDQLYLAQNNSEERLLAHEEDIREMKENQIDQLLRIKEGIRSPISPIMGRSIRSPRSFLLQAPVAEDVKVAQLREKISQLEQALLDADKEITKVVSHLNAAQIQMMNLQNEREEAIQETKRLKKLIEDEKVQANSITWKSIISF